MAGLDHQRSAAKTLVNKMGLDTFVLFNIFNYCRFASYSDFAFHRSFWKSFSGTAVLSDKVLKQFNTNWAHSWVRRAVWLTESNSMPRKDILCIGTSLLFSQLSPKAQQLEHQVPVCTQLLARQCKYEPVVEVVENTHTPFSHGVTQLGWRREATGTARRAGPCTEMPDPRTRIAGMACVVGGSRHESMRPSGRLLQTNLGDGRTRNAFLRQYLERQLMKCTVQNSQIQDRS